MMRHLNTPVLGALVFLLTACGAPLVPSASLDDADDVFVWDTQQAPPLSPPGPGAGPWGSEPQTPDNVMLAQAAKAYLGTSGARQRYGTEAAGSFRHYFDNDGADYPVDLD